MCKGNHVNNLCLKVSGTCNKFCILDATCFCSQYSIEAHIQASVTIIYVT